MFGQHFTKKNQNYGCIIEGCDCISAISKKQSILKIPQHCQCSLNCVQTLYSGRYEVVLPITICFIKIGVVLSDILTSQKCIKWGWCIIKGWMTVFLQAALYPDMTAWLDQCKDRLSSRELWGDIAKQAITFVDLKKWLKEKDWAAEVKKYQGKGKKKASPSPSPSPRSMMIGIRLWSRGSTRRL